MKNMLRPLAALVLLVVFGVPGFAQGNPDKTPPNQRHYLTFGRNPMIPGGLTFQQAKDRGWEPFELTQDLWTTMYGASGERVTGWIRAGTKVCWEKGLNYDRLRILDCGNLTDVIRYVVKEPGKEIPIKGDTEFIAVPVIKEIEVPGPVQYRTEYITEYRDRYLPIMILAPQQQYIANLGSPTVVSPVLNGIPGFYNNGGIRINNSNFQAQLQKQIAEAAAAAAAAASSSSSSTAVTPTSGAGTSGSGSSGSSGSAGGGGGSSGSGSG